MPPEEAFYELAQKVAVMDERLERAITEVVTERQSRQTHLSIVEGKLDEINVKLHQFLFGNGKQRGLAERIHDLEEAEKRRDQRVRWLMGVAGGGVVTLIAKITYDIVYLLPHLTELIKTTQGVH